jgi:hypothetical protein
VTIGGEPSRRGSNTERLVAQVVRGNQEDAHQLNLIIPGNGLHVWIWNFVFIFLAFPFLSHPGKYLGGCAAMTLLLLATAQAQMMLPLPQKMNVPSETGHISEKDLIDARKPLPPDELEAKPGRQDFNLKDSSRSLFERVAGAFGLEVVFDTDYQELNNVRFQVSDLNYRDSLRALEAATDSFLTPVSKHLIFVARDTASKRRDFARNVAVTIPIPDPVSVQEMQEIANSVRSVLDIRRLIVDADKRMVLIRDVVGKVRPAQIMIEELMHPQPQVMVECDLMAVTSSSQLHYGLALPTSFPLIAFGSPKYPNVFSSAISSGVSGFLGFGGGLSFLGLGLTDTQLFASLSKSFATTLDSAQVLASQGQPAELKFGTKYPIVTNQYVGQTTGVGQTYSPPPTVQFEDLGLVVKVVPHVHGLDEVTLDIETSFKLLTGSALDNIPVIADREFKGSVRLVAGQSAVITGLMSANEARTVTGLAGVSSVPLIGKFLRENEIDKSRDQTLIVIKPRIVIAPPAELATRDLWVGSETRPAETL